MRFYLGTHQPDWVEKTNVPLFLSRRRLQGRKRPLRPSGPWALDSGGFTELSMYGEWRTSQQQYADEVSAWSQWGGLEWAAPRDWMCEPWIIEKTGLSVDEHQSRTVEDFCELRDRGPFVPVLQGWTLADYERCHVKYAQAGVRLEDEPLVGIGSVCRRQQTRGGREVVEAFSHLRLHAFGLKLDGLREVGYLLASSDSMAWSYGARYQPPLPGCTHKACNNCLRFALLWREQVLLALSVQQPTLWGDTWRK